MTEQNMNELSIFEELEPKAAPGGLHLSGGIKIHPDTIVWDMQ